MEYKVAGFGVCGKGEADRYLKATLEEFKRLCDETYIVCNNCSSKEIEMIKSFGFNIIEDNREWGKEQWRIKEDAIKNIKADWFVVLDMDEVFDKEFTREELDKLCKKGGAGYYFYIVNLYENGYSQNWSFWNVRLFNGSYCREWEKKALHCGLAPKIAYYWGNYAPFLLKHYGLKEKENRDRKVERYLKYDPQAQYKSKSYYDFLSSKEAVAEFNEDKLHKEVGDEVKDYKHKIPNNMSEQNKKFYMVKNPAGRVVDIEEDYLEETLAREGFELISKDAIEVAGEGVKTTQPVKEEVKEVKKEGFVCEVCGFVAKSKAGLTTHMKKHA